MNKKVSIISLISVVLLSSCSSLKNNIQNDFNPDIKDINVFGVNKLKDNITEKEKEITALRWKYMQELNKKDKVIEQKQQELNNLKEKYKKLQSDSKQSGLIEELKDKKQKLETELNNQKQEITKLKQDFETKKIELETVKFTLVEKNKKITELQKKFFALNFKSMADATKVKELNKKITETSEKYQQELDKKKELTKQTEELKNKINILITERDNYKKQYDDTKIELGRVKTELETSLNDIKDKNNDLKNKDNLIKEKDDKITKIIKELTEKNIELANLQKENQKLKTKHNTDFKLIASLLNDPYCLNKGCIGKFKDNIKTFYDKDNVTIFTVKNSGKETKFSGNCILKEGGSCSVIARITDNTGIGDIHILSQQEINSSLYKGNITYSDIDFTKKNFYSDKISGKLRDYTETFLKVNDGDVVGTLLETNDNSKNEIIGEFNFKIKDGNRYHGAFIGKQNN